MSEIEHLRQRIGDLEKENALLKQSVRISYPTDEKMDSWLLKDILANSNPQTMLQDSIELNQTILDNVHVGMVAYSLSGKCILANEAVARILGATKKQVLAQNIREVGSWKKHGLLNDVDQVLEQGGEVEDQVQLTSSFGKTTWIEYHMRRFWLQGAWHLFVSVADISDRKLAEEQLSIFHRFTEASEQGLGMADMQGNITYANPGLCRLLGVPQASEITGTNVIDYYSQADQVRMQEEILPHVVEHGHQEIEIPIRSIQGKLTPTIQSIFVIRDQEGQSIFLANVLTDITQQKKLEQELRQHRDQLEKLVAERTEHLLTFNRELRLSEEHYRLLVENIPLRILIKDKDSTYVSCNSLFARDLGVSASDQIAGRRDEEFFDEAYVKMTLAEDQLVLERGETIESEHVYPVGSDMLTVRMIKTPMRDESGVIVGVLGMFQDITTQRQLKNQLQQAQKMDAIGQLAGGIAHDFNNLLVGILGAADMLACELRHNSVMMSYVRLITEASSRAAELIKQLLAFSRKSHNQNIQVDVHKMIENSISILERTIDRRVSINRKLQADMAIVKGDPARLESLILNLGVNARDAMPEGGELVVQTRNVHLAPDFCRERELDPTREMFLEVLVKDSGCGMDADTLGHIFEPFFTTKGEGKGTGLGLAAVYGTVKDHQGHIEVESHKDRGTRFTIYLPAESTPDESPVCDTGEVVFQSGHVLVIDDDNIALTGAKSVLESLGYKVTVATDGIAGIHAFKELQHEIDLVLLDLVMPKMNGEDVFRELKKIDPDLKVVISSGYSRNLVIDRMLDAGVMRFLQKPYRAKELARIVHDLTISAD